jgi:hypothetical protein
MDFNLGDVVVKITDTTTVPRGTVGKITAVYSESLLVLWGNNTLNRAYRIRDHNLFFKKINTVIDEKDEWAELLEVES